MLFFIKKSPWSKVFFATGDNYEVYSFLNEDKQIDKIVHLKESNATYFEQIIRPHCDQLCYETTLHRFVNLVSPGFLKKVFYTASLNDFKQRSAFYRLYGLPETYSLVYSASVLCDRIFEQ